MSAVALSHRIVSPGGLPLRVEEKIERVTDSGCWIWMGGIRSGYGQTSIGRRNVAAHRAVYEWLRGPIPPGLDLDHLCRVRSCVNPDHLEPVTRRVNLLRGNTLPAANAAMRACKCGHPYTERVSRGRKYRACRRCEARRRRPYQTGRRAYSQAHAKHEHLCPCGLVCRGNGGWGGHRKVCPKALALHEAGRLPR